MEEEEVVVVVAVAAVAALPVVPAAVQAVESAVQQAWTVSVLYSEAQPIP